MLALGVFFTLATAFLVIYRLPGDPARMILGPRADAQTIKSFRSAAGIDQPIWVQFGRFAKKTMQLDFGDSLVQRAPVSGLIRARVGYTIKLISLALGILILGAVLLPLALMSFHWRTLDAIIRNGWTCTAASPPYVLAVIVFVLFAGFFGWMPAVFEPSRILCWLAPAFVLAVYPTALVSRLFRDALERALSSDYSTRARAQGYSNRAILLREALPNAITAPVSALANGLAYFVTGTFFVEVAFGIGGLGTLTYEAVRNKDIPVLSAVCLIFAVAVSVISATLDVMQRLLTPALRRGRD